MRAQAQVQATHAQQQQQQATHAQQQQQQQQQQLQLLRQQFQLQLQQGLAAAAQSQAAQQEIVGRLVSILTQTHHCLYRLARRCASQCVELPIECVRPLLPQPRLRRRLASTSRLDAP